MRVIVFLLIIVILTLDFAVANVPQGQPEVLQIRAGEHNGFMRIVLEGHESVISKGKLSHKGKDITVRFTDKNFEIIKSGLPMTCNADRDSITFNLKQEASLKAYALKDPSRFVIDVYPEKGELKKQTKTEDRPEVKKIASTKAVPLPVVSKKDYAKPAVIIPAAKPEKNYDEKSLIPDKYKAKWSLLESGKFYDVLREIPIQKPENAESRAALNYIYAKANIMAKQYLEAVKYFRLAYIYATDTALKEQALLKRAGLYMDLKLVYEARADYLVFLRDFPSSAFIEKAHFGLAESLYKIGQYQEAIDHYKQSGSSAAVLYGMANTLQKLDMVQEANKAYEQAMQMDSTFIKLSPETAYLMAENMRMSGDLVNAKINLSQIESGPFAERAIISLGTIAMDESDNQLAVSTFKTAAQARDQKVRVQALFNLALVYVNEGKHGEAISCLEEIRHNHIDSNMYKEALLALAKIYKKGGRIKESVSLLKELVYGKQPPADAFNVLEEIVLEAGRNSGQDNLTVVKLWSEVGQWLIDESREEFLLKVANYLRHEGQPFLDLCSWLVENASERARGRAAIDLAGYYIGIGSTAMSRNYINVAKGSGETGDAVLRVEAKIYHSEGDRTAALKQIMMIKEIENDDFVFLGKIISEINDPGLKELQKAIAFYENKLNESEWSAETYIDFADVLYRNDERGKALKYYRIAREINPENEWAMYRVARDAGMPEAEDILNRLQKGDNLISRLAKSKLTEMTLLNRVREVY